MLGNFVTGLAIAGVTGMLGDLARGLGVTIPQAGLLVTAGAIVLCFGSPLTVWATSGFDRRRLLAGSLVLVALGHFASAAAPGYGALLALRVLTMAAAALFTPVAASTVALIVPPAERAAAIAFVFLGWSLAVALGLPAVAFLARHAGWQATYAALGAALIVVALYVYHAVPAGVRGARVSAASWVELARHRLVVTLLLVTATHIAGQFVVFTYLAPLLTRLGGAGVAAIGLFFSLFGVAGFIGNVVATRLVGRLGAFATSVLSLLCILLGLGLWSLGAGRLVVMGAGTGLWGLGFAAINSMQQARLVAAVPPLGAASVSLNTSAIYVGQAVGSAIGGALFARELLPSLGYVAMAFVALAFALLASTREERVPARQ